jgi:hypothetical protein
MGQHAQSSVKDFQKFNFIYSHMRIPGCLITPEESAGRLPQLQYQKKYKSKRNILRAFCDLRHAQLS